MNKHWLIDWLQHMICTRIYFVIYSSNIWFKIALCFASNSRWNQKLHFALVIVSCSPGRTSVPLKCLACAAGPDHRVTTFTTILIIFSCLSISRCTALSWSLWSMASDNTLDHTHHILDHTHQSQKFGVAESLSRGGRCKARLPSNY